MLCACECTTLRGQKRVSNALELRSQEIVRYPKWVLGTAWLFCKSSAHSLALNILSRPCLGLFTKVQWGALFAFQQDLGGEMHFFSSFFYQIADKKQVKEGVFILVLPIWGNTCHAERDMMPGSLGWMVTLLIILYYFLFFKIKK